MPYKVFLEKAAEKYLRRQDRDSQVRLLKAIKALPPDKGVKKLKGFDSTFRVRVGDVRIIFSIDEATHSVRVIAIGPRGQVYRSLT